jgi:hypothetical protein
LGPLTNKTQLLDVAFQVYNNCDLEEERMEQSEERRQVKLMAAMIGGATKAQKTSSGKKTKKPSCFKCRNLEHLANNCPETPPGLSYECSKTEDTQWHWRRDFLTLRERLSRSKLWLYPLEPHVTEELWGALNSSCISLSSLMRNLGLGSLG